MRVLGEIPHPECKITIFHWNGKYLLKFERGPLEQTYKISEMDITGEEEVIKLVETPFMGKILERFTAMEQDLYEAMDNV